MRHLTITIMTYSELTEGFDYLTENDGLELNRLQSVATFELEDAAPLEPRTFDLVEYAQALSGLTAAQLDEFCEKCSRPNPKRKVRRNNA